VDQPIPSPLTEKPNAEVRSTLLPRLAIGEWIVFALLAGLIAGANIYSTLLIGWGDTGSVVAVLASVVLLGAIGRKRPGIYTLNLGQTMVSAGGGVGFAVASYASVHIAEPGFDPPWYQLVPMFAAMGMFGALVGTSVRKQMVRYYFPSGTACALIQNAVTKELAPGERNRPVFMLKLWGTLAAIATFPTLATFKKGGEALLQAIEIRLPFDRLPVLGIGVEPLYYGIGMVVGPRIGLGMIIGSLSSPLVVGWSLENTAYAADTGDWIKWAAIAVLTVPTFVTIVFAYLYKSLHVTPPQFKPGRTTFLAPERRKWLYGGIAIVCTPVIAVTAQLVFGLPWFIAIFTMMIAWPLCIVNGRVAGDTDINPVRLVAIVLLSGFFWMVADPSAITLLGMAVVGGTMAAIAVDMMQDYRTGHLLDQDSGHQTVVQFVGTIVGAIVAVPVLGLLLDARGIGEGSTLPAPGATIWAAMADAMRGGFQPSAAMIWMIVGVSVGGSIYAWLTVHPKTSNYMPSLFGIGIGMLLGLPASMAIFLGGMIRVVVAKLYSARAEGESAKQAASEEARSDTMLAGASIFAASAVVSILLIFSTTLMDLVGWENWRFYLPGGGH
jgi:uncharacterized oligopeptide transporter (OPT) family protein